MTEDHERIEELLAGYALEALSGPDAEAAERLLTEHVPTCVTCRRLLDDYRTVVGDLALAAQPLPAPELLLGALHRDLSDTAGLATRRRRGVPVWVGTVAAVALLALGGWNAFLAQRVSDVEGLQDLSVRALNVFGDPASRVVPMRDAKRTSTSAATLAYIPGETQVYLLVRMPRPHRHHEYEVWFTKGGRAVAPAGTFRTRRGFAILQFSVDVTQYDGIWITEEPDGGSDHPTGPALLEATV